eukprot:1379349-Amorphochlora_amoeboformis.AAC.1
MEKVQIRSHFSTLNLSLCALSLSLSITLLCYIRLWSPRTASGPSLSAHASGEEKGRGGERAKREERSETEKEGERRRVGKGGKGRRTERMRGKEGAREW